MTATKLKSSGTAGAVELRTHAITPMEMLQTAVEKGADLEQLQKLMDLQERWEANEARKAFVHALNLFKANPPTITKDKKVDFATSRGRTEYEYATLGQVANLVAQELSKHGLSHRWEIQQDQRVGVTCVLTHEMGHSERVTMSGPADESGAKNPIQAIASTVSYLERYTLLAITGLAAGDMDDDARGATAQTISPEMKNQLIELCRHKADPAKVTKRLLAALKVADLDSLPASQFPQAVELLNRVPDHKEDAK